MRKIIFLAAAFLLLGTMPAVAQETTEVTTDGGIVTVTTEENVVVTNEDIPVTVANDEVLSETVSVPGTLGLFWRNIRERVTLALTFNPVAKAEKQLQFAQERMSIAEMVATQAVNNPKLQDKAEKIMERANQLMEKIQERQELFNNGEDTRVRVLLRNTATQMVQREAVMNKIEAVLSPERLQKFETTRMNNIENSQRLLNALENENIPEEIQNHLQDVKEFIEAHATEVKQFQEEKKDLLERAASGDEEAKVQLQELHQERIETREERQGEKELLMQEGRTIKQEAQNTVREVKQEIRNQTVQSNIEAAKQLRAANQVQERIENRVNGQISASPVVEPVQEEIKEELQNRNGN
ncbi:MAG: hypothetical protein COU29_01395 [Candidatus Magasanikbacteria bacterium CG10_big_fil_rev_8_21_14_0_10_36_32]|uniref:DUF5667 domain-containing protein n=1 Tax=Candidatus Magasanikbacteria bacterium CG10_big_fil_rev_8_21_14_0_10_36_32 TaxID=1974646 RepID=A0A2M6W6L8_9BACT|nr:MAG: hypothetical protein COU29_01395 [Candidatus Magasanikbacteria bacterium CG10_big_fil_rev_8_21_14_0_10_36_32]